ncbi:hypothetical protein [Thermococcus sp. MAR1]|uniref:hypothetical protein n=1 Tax=Thermococcus sp. MAR1 TaxID=1638263 RepID=UPI0014397096|nr:hypothetical protein [Thermococcus sp. MAR1]NJE09365.1 hypothetical protein [Thermococcus sp. MAR1]
MRKVLVVVFALMLMASSPPASAKIQPYVYTPTVPETSFAVLALYKTGDYTHVLEGCEWLMAIKTPFDSWGYKYGEEHEAKYTAMAMLALMRGERIARGRYNSTLNSAAYWLIYRQNADGSWEDYTGTALSVLALKEFLDGDYIDDRLVGFREQVKEAIERGEGYLYSVKPQNDVERIFGYLALEDSKDLEKMSVNGKLSAYRAFALAYLGKGSELVGEFNDTLSIAMALYATGDEKYREELLKMEHFGFWGVLHYRVLDLLGVSKIRSFEDLRPIACPYLSKIQVKDDWEKVVLADYFLTCNKTPKLPSNLSGLLPWQVAELARVKALMGMDYQREVDYLISTGKNGVWRDFYNTEYVVLVFRFLNVSYNYSPSLDYLRKNLTWMIETTNPENGNPAYYNIPTYYLAYAVIVFIEFGMENELKETLEMLKERQYPNGAFPYTQGSIAGITSTAKVLWALEKAGLANTPIHSRGISFLRKLIYADIPNPKAKGSVVVLENATFILVKNSGYVGNTTGKADVKGLDGYVVIYPTGSPLTIAAYEVSGFRTVGTKRHWSSGYTYFLLGTGLLLVALLMWRKK